MNDTLTFADGFEMVLEGLLGGRGLRSWRRWRWRFFQKRLKQVSEQIRRQIFVQISRHEKRKSVEINRLWRGEEEEEKGGGIVIGNIL